jgi:hypothetical protein
MMRDIIKRHNRLNGVPFSTIEFGLIALLIGTFATYYTLNHRVLSGLVAWGITLNCLPVVVYGARAWRDSRRSGERIGSYWDRRFRKQHERENPHMLRDTLVLTLATLVPFGTLIALLFDLFQASRRSATRHQSQELPPS